MFMAISIISWLSAEDASRNRKLREIRPRSPIETSMMDGAILPTILKTENLILGPLGEEHNEVGSSWPPVLEHRSGLQKDAGLCESCLNKTRTRDLRMVDCAGVDKCS